MHMLRCLFFIEGHHQFRLSAIHIPGIHNDLADDLSRNNLSAFFAGASSSEKIRTQIPPLLLQWLLNPDMDWTSPSWTVLFSSKGIAASTHKTYGSALCRFANFCSCFSIMSPFPVSESVLCYFASYLAHQNLSPQTIKTYLADVCHTQITLGLPEPKEFAFLPRLHLVQAGIKRVYSQRSPQAKRIRLPITPAILKKMHSHWSSVTADPDIKMLWAAAVLCFFGFFRSVELLVPSQKVYNAAEHLSWGDVTVDSQTSPKMLKVVLKKSKTDQFGAGAQVYVGRTGCTLCPVAAVLEYMVARGNEAGPFFRLANGRPLTKPLFTQRVRQALQAVGLPYNNFAGHSFRIGAAKAAAQAGVEDSTIQILGRWSSAAFLTYIRTPRE